MRRRDCLSTQRASSLLAGWMATYTRSCRYISTPPPAAATTAAALAANEGSGNNSSSSGSTNTTHTASTAANELAADVARTRGGNDASLKVASATASAAAMADAVAEATERLRAALRVLSVIEQAKSDEQKLKLTHSTAEVSPIDVEPDSKEVPMAEASGTPGEPPAPPATATDHSSAASSSHSPLTANDSRTKAAANLSSPSWASARSLWVRNKQPKFWAIVNEAGGGDDGVEAPPTHPEKLGKGITTAESRDTAEPAAHRTPALMLSSQVAASVPSPSLSPATQKATSVKEPASATSLSVHGNVGGASVSLAATTASLKSADTPTTTPAASLSSSLPSEELFTPATASKDAAGRAAPVSAESIRASSSVPPFRSRYKKDVAHALSELLSRDPALGPQLLGQLSAESRRLMLIMGTASEYFGVDYGEVAEQIKEADTDRDNSISAKEFDAWVGHMAGLASTRRNGDQAKHTPAADQHVEGSSLSTVSTMTSASASLTQPGSTTVATTTATAASTCSSSLPSPQAESRVYVTTMTTSDPLKHVVVDGATLSRQRAEMTISTARAASARIIEVMQKDVALQTGGDTADKTASSSEAAKQQQQLSPPSTSAAASVAAKIVTATGPGSTGLVTSSPPPPTSTVTAPPHHPPTTRTAADAVVAATSAKTGVADATTAIAAKKGDAGYIPWPTFAKIVLSAAPPFLAFGMLDNCTLVLAGGAIDNALSAKLGLTQMTAASLGGVVSGVAGIQVHGLAERFTRAKPPQLTPEQQRSDSFQRAENLGNTLGMVVGLIIGMTPLLLMRLSSQDTDEAEAAEHKRFRDEAVRSHQRRCKALVKAEGQERQALEKEERAARETLAHAIGSASVALCGE
jgi:hypothetical protein